MTFLTSDPAESLDGPVYGQRAANAVYETGNRVTHRAADAVVDHVVRPMAQAVGVVEERAVRTNRYLSNSIHRVEDEVHSNPVRALGYAAAAGFLAGLWFSRK